MEYLLRILLFFSVVASLSNAKLYAALKDVKVDGYLDSTLEVESFKNGELNHRAKIEAETKRKNGVKAEFAVRFESNQNESEFRESVINKKFDDGWRLEFGFTKKRFGLEYEYDKLKRSTIRRSPVYRRLEIFTYASRETMLRWYRKADFKKDRAGYELSLGNSAAQNTSLLASTKIPLSEVSTFSSWLQIQSDHIDDGQQIVWALMSAMEHKMDRHKVVNEVLIAVDPDQTELNKTLDLGDEAYFAAWKGEYNYVISKSPDGLWLYIMQTSFAAQDLDVGGYNSIQLLVGTSYYVEPLTLAINLDGVGSTSRIDPTNRNYSESNVRLEAVYEF